MLQIYQHFNQQLHLFNLYTITKKMLAIVYMYNSCTSHAHEKIKYASDQMAHAAGAYPGLRSMKQLGVFLLPPG